ncbi:MAG: hypothetical protein KA715_04645 [Xanthomonadaceae bacterium]|nr:hypothetical protein [Xanthomonadaceae bacterium]
MGFVRLFIFIILLLTEVSLAREPVTHVILFGGEDGSDYYNQFYKDFDEIAKSFSPQIKLYLHYGGEKTKRIFVSETWKRKNLERSIGLKEGSIKDATLTQLKLTLLEIYQTIQPDDQVLLIVETHGSCSLDGGRHLWRSSEKNSLVNNIDPKEIYVFFENIQKKKGKIAIIDGSCYGGESINYFGDVACVLSETTKNLTTCSTEFLSIWNSLARSKTKQLPVTELYKKMSELTAFSLKDCESQPVISGYPDHSDYWYSWLMKVIDESNKNIPDFPTDFNDGERVCKSEESPSQVNQWISRMKNEKGSPLYFKNELLDRMKPYMNSKNKSDVLRNEYLKTQSDLLAAIRNLSPILFEKNYPTTLFDFGDDHTSLNIAQLEKVLTLDYSGDGDSRPLKTPLTQTSKVSYQRMKQSKNSLMGEVYQVSIPIFPNEKLFSNASFSHTRVHSNQYPSEKIRLSYDVLLSDIRKFVDDSYPSHILGLKKNRDLAEEKIKIFKSGGGSFNNNARKEANKLITEHEDILRNIMSEIQVWEYGLHVKDLKWKKENKKLTEIESKQLEQIKRCEEFKLDFGK